MCIVLPLSECGAGVEVVAGLSAAGQPAKFGMCVEKWVSLVRAVAAVNPCNAVLEFTLQLLRCVRGVAPANFAI